MNNTSKPNPNIIKAIKAAEQLAATHIPPNWRVIRVEPKGRVGKDGAQEWTAELAARSAGGSSRYIWTYDLTPEAAVAKMATILSGEWTGWGIK